MMLLRPFLLFLLSFLLLVFSGSEFCLARQPFDHSTWDQFLKKYVNQEGLLDYPAIKNDPELLNNYLNQIEKVNFKELIAVWPREESLAFLLNAYNSAVIKIVLDHYPVKSIQNIPSVWDLQFFLIGNIKFSLNTIRRDLLINRFHDEKINVVLSCGAISCPPLSMDAFEGPSVEGQLYKLTRKFVNSSNHVEIKVDNNKIWISKLFKWYAPEFEFDYGQAENDRGLSRQQFAVLSFIVHYLDDSEKIRFLENGNYKIKYLRFNWDLNDASKKRK